MADKCKKAKNVCRSDFEKNRLRRMRAHLKRNPLDRDAQARFRGLGGKLQMMGDLPLELVSKGRKVIRRISVKHQLRYDRNQVRLARLEAIRQRALAGETIEQQIIADGVAA